MVLVHGFAQNRFSWDCAGRSFARWLAERGWEVVNLELRGHGRSGGRAEGGFEDYVEDLARVCAELGRPFVMGHSLGGTVGYAAAMRVDLAGVVGIGAAFRFGRAQRFLRLLSRLTLASPLLLRRARVRTQLSAMVITRLLGLSDAAAWWAPMSGWWPGSVEPELLRERLRLGFDHTTVQVWLDMASWSVEGRSAVSEEAWRSCAVPLLLIVGDEDRLMPLGDARPAYDLHPGPDKTLLVMNQLEHEVHWGHLDMVLGRHAPEHVWPAVDAWMAARSPG